MGEKLDDVAAGSMPLNDGVVVTTGDRHVGAEQRHAFLAIYPQKRALLVGEFLVG